MEDDTSAYIFSLPGHKPDVLFTVYDKPVHAHSIILKSFSTFFRKLMDVPIPPEQDDAGFRYEFVVTQDNTEPGGRGDWGLEKAPFFVARTGRWERKGERQAFLILLKKMYGREACAIDMGIFVSVFRLAEFFCVLPVLSHSVKWAPGMEHSPGALLNIAEKLQNPFLFKECFVRLVARWDRTERDRDVQRWILTYHPHLYSLLKKSYADVCTKLMDTEFRVIEFVKQCNRRPFWENLKASDLIKRGYLCEYYQRVSEECSVFLNRGDISTEHREFCLKIIEIVEPILKKNVRPCRYLLPLCYCAEIEDKDLPWETKQGGL